MKTPIDKLENSTIMGYGFIIKKEDIKQAFH